MCFLAVLLKRGRNVKPEHVRRAYRSRALIEAALRQCAKDDALRPRAFDLGIALKQKRVIKRAPSLFSPAR